MSAFGDGIMRFRIAVEEQSDQLFRKIILDLDYKVVYRTPVDSGRAQGNWTANIGSSPVWSETSERGAAAAIGSIQSIVSEAKMATDTVWLSNGLPYITVLEYGLFPNPPKAGAGKTAAGFSTQAVGGMISISAAEFGDAIVETT